MQPPDDSSDTLVGSTSDVLGARLRARRQEVGLSVRELSRRIGMSASLVSQIETGKVQPSVPTLYALVAELGASFDDLLFGEADGGKEAGGKAFHVAALDHPPVPLVQRAHDRKTLQLGHGIRWERLTRESVPGVEFLYVEYQPGAESGGPDEYQRHSGREWCYVVSGHLDIVVGFDSYNLEAGDAITFDSTTPHRLSNKGSQPAISIWFQLR
ncbi:MAG: cupin domain-containing protein [Nitriliruptorales bacterium]|nr:cupin domain-containing protein [Nitriliruptorales bacterium]